MQFQLFLRKYMNKQKKGKNNFYKVEEGKNKKKGERLSVRVAQEVSTSTHFTPNTKQLSIKYENRKLKRDITDENSR